MEQYRAAKAPVPGPISSSSGSGLLRDVRGGREAALAPRSRRCSPPAAPTTGGGVAPDGGGAVPRGRHLPRPGSLRKGFKVALCDQVEDARAERGSSAARSPGRDPGHARGGPGLPGPEHNFLAAVELPAHGTGTIAAVDVTTGELFLGEAGSSRRRRAGARASPRSAPRGAGTPRTSGSRRAPLDLRSGRSSRTARSRDSAPAPWRRPSPGGTPFFRRPTVVVARRPVHSRPHLLSGPNHGCSRTWRPGRRTRPYVGSNSTPRRCVTSGSAGR